MTLNELRKLCKTMCKQGWKDSNIYIYNEDVGQYIPIEIFLNPNEYGDIVVITRRLA